MMEDKKVQQMTPKQKERYEERKKEWLRQRREKEEQRKREEEEKILRSRARMIAEYRLGHCAVPTKHSELHNQKLRTELCTR